jgi:hypothetical protein
MPILRGGSSEQRKGPPSMATEDGEKEGRENKERGGVLEVRLLPPLLENKQRSTVMDVSFVVLDLCMLPGVVLLRSPPLCAVSALCCASVRARWSTYLTANMSDEIT